MSLAAFADVIVHGPSTLDDDLEGVSRSIDHSSEGGSVTCVELEGRG